MLKMHQLHNSVHTFHISFAITHTERNYAVRHCHISEQLIRSFRQSVQQPTLCAAMRLLIDTLPWPELPDFSTNDGEHIARMISRTALQHL